MKISPLKKKGELGGKNRVRGDMSTKQTFVIFIFCPGQAMYRKLSDLLFFLAQPGKSMGYSLLTALHRAG